jgi:hypothetical protein
VRLKEGEHFSAMLGRNVAPRVTVAVQVLFVEVGKALAQRRTVVARDAAGSHADPSQHGQFVVSEHEWHAQFPQNPQHAARIWSAMEQVSAGHESVLGGEPEVLHQPRELLRAAVDVADDPSGHVHVGIGAKRYALERGTA